MRRLVFLAAGLALLLCVGAAAFGGGESSPSDSTAGRWLINGKAGDVNAYGWPVRPFADTHPVRGNFCDPRYTKSSATFHFGIDISAPDGTSVYPVRSGVVYLRGDHPDVVGVTSADGRSRFEYWHITPAVRTGERAVARTTLLGWIKKGRAHVHFTEINDRVWVNPLRPGALGPYDDSTAPVVGAIRFERAGHMISPERISGVVDIVAAAYDTPSLSAPEPWATLPVTPVVVRWRLLHQRVPLTRWQTVVDCSRSLPLANAFADVYTGRTRKSGPGKPGRYDYSLARGWRSESLPRGVYRIEVVALDVRGNRGEHMLDFTIVGRDLP